MKQFFPKGRQTDDELVEKVRSLIGHLPQERDLLLEYLHVLQDHFGHLAKDVLAALASVMKLSQAQVYEVATFYAHFKTDGPRPSRKKCNSLSCALFSESAEKSDLEAVPCVGQCDLAPYTFDLQDKISLPDYTKLEDHPYETFARFKGKTEAVLSELEKADLRGMGGAGFPVARKWRFFDGKDENRVLVINADEGEPGTFKDRFCLETSPHKMLEGILIAADHIGAKDIYIYLRDEYALAREILLIELEKLRAAPFAQEFNIHLRRGAGAYICGEETALLESLEGKRGLPRLKPPYPAQDGLFGRPTLINNVETLWRVQDILEKGSADYIERGYPRFYSLSGRVQKPGVYEASHDITINELINEHGGGMREGETFKAYLPGGASGGILPASMSDLPLKFGALEEHGCFIGSAAVVVLSDQDNMKDVVQNLMEFFDHESCGQCTPCRVGCEKIAVMLQANTIDRPLFEELSDVMQSSSICGLGQAAPNPLLGALKHFAEDFA